MDQNLKEQYAKNIINAAGFIAFKPVANDNDQMSDEYATRLISDKLSSLQTVASKINSIIKNQNIISRFEYQEKSRREKEMAREAGGAPGASPVNIEPLTGLEGFSDMFDTISEKLTVFSKVAKSAKGGGIGGGISDAASKLFTGLGAAAAIGAGALGISALFGDEAEAAEPQEAPVPESRTTSQQPSTAAWPQLPTQKAEAEKPAAPRAGTGQYLKPLPEEKPEPTIMGPGPYKGGYVTSEEYQTARERALGPSSRINAPIIPSDKKRIPAPVARPTTTQKPSLLSRASTAWDNIFEDIKGAAAGVGASISGVSESVFNAGPGEYAAADISGAKGAWKDDKEFISAVNRVSKKYNIDANDLLGLMYHESAGSMSPSIRNKSGYVGLIQFGTAAAKDLGISQDQLSRMSRAQQMEYVDRYFALNKLPRGANAGQLYAAVFLPGIARKKGWSGVLSVKGDKFYGSNPSLDPNGDGRIDFGDLASVINNARKRMGLGSSKSITGIRAAINTARNVAGNVSESISGIVPGFKIPFFGDTGKFVTPTAGRISSRFGMRGGRPHKGMDFAAPTGTPVVASKSGVVSFAGSQRGYGNVIYINHANGISTRYGHLSRIGVSAGQQVQAGQLVGLVGNTGRSTGPHLHFEIRKNGQALNPEPLLSGTKTVEQDFVRAQTATEPGIAPVAKPKKTPNETAPSTIQDQQLRKKAWEAALKKPKESILVVNNNQGGAVNISRGGGGRRSVSSGHNQARDIRKAFGT